MQACSNTSSLKSSKGMWRRLGLGLGLGLRMALGTVTALTCTPLPASLCRLTFVCLFTRGFKSPQTFEAVSLFGVHLRPRSALPWRGAGI